MTSDTPSASPERKSARRRVIVNESFVHRVLEGRNPIGRRVRELSEDPGDGAPGPWLEIIGVVKDLGIIWVA